jgi:hypothetical protein
MHAIITAYRQHLVFQLLATQSVPREVKTSLDNDGCLGQTVFDSARNLGVSREAAELLKKVRAGKDPIGDIFWKAQESGRHTFAWRGGPLVAMSPDVCKGSDSFRVRAYALVSNDVRPIPQHLRVMLDAFGPVDAVEALRLAA